LGAVSNQAIERFSVLAVELSTLAVMQLMAYALMQIPAGFIIDRFGIRWSMAFGLGLIAIGQVHVALAELYWVAAGGRLLLGIGDAFIFISLVRLIQTNLSGRKSATWQQLLTNIGQLGQVASAVPFAWFLGLQGWSSAFLGLAALAAASASLVVLGVRTAPRVIDHSNREWQLLKRIRETREDSAARAAFWTHFTLQSSGSTFVLLWGRTYLERVYEVSDAQAGLLLSSFVVFAFLLGPVIARVSTRSGAWRRRTVTGIAIWIVIAWLSTEILSSSLGLISIWLVMPALAAGGAGSMIAFQITQAHCPESRLGVANGFANIGGFLATLIMMALVGFVVDLAFELEFSDERYGATGLQAGFVAHLVVLLFGLWRFRKNHEKISV
jgi:MFS family permease